MKESHLHYLVCPACQSALALHSVEQRTVDCIETATLLCTNCAAIYPIISSIPRFVSRENYASSFGYEWNRHATTQYDSQSGSKISEERFFQETNWAHDLSGEVILEVGSGSGRFTEQAASTGAFVVSMDYSSAVEANYQSNGQRENVLIVQADLYTLPFHRASFDKVFCFGVLQHTPDVHKAFQALPPMLRPGGSLAVDIYKKTFFRTYLASKYHVRYFTRHMDAERLYRLTRHWVDFVWPLSRLISKIPRIGPTLNWRLLIPDFSREKLDEKQLKEWAYLDIFDMLSPRYDSPQRMKTLQSWFQEAKLTDLEFFYGYTGIVGRGKRPKYNGLSAPSPRRAGTDAFRPDVGSSSHKGSGQIGQHVLPIASQQ